MLLSPIVFGVHPKLIHYRSNTVYAVTEKRHLKNAQCNIYRKITAVPSCKTNLMIDETSNF